MARNNYGSLTDQISERIKEFNRLGQSKYDAQQKERATAEAEGRYHNRAKVEGIYDLKTMKHYTDIGHRWAKWVEENVPDLVKGRSLNDMKDAAAAYIKDRQAEGLTNWTLKADRSALAKIIGMPGQDICYLPPRRKEDRVKNTKMPIEFSEARNRDLVDLCRASGLRHHEVAQLSPAHLSAKDGRLILTGVVGKGGEVRDVVITRAGEARVIEIFQGKDQGEQIITKIPIRTPCLIYRRQYVAARNEELRLDGILLQTERDKIIIQDLGNNTIESVSNYR